MREIQADVAEDPSVDRTLPVGLRDLLEPNERPCGPVCRVRVGG
jgi:hypothetical protein